MTGWAIDQLRADDHEQRRRRSSSSSAPARAPSPRRIATEAARRRWCTRSSCRRKRPRTPRATWPTRRSELHVGDMADALPELDGTVDLVIANPPYIPLEAYESVAPEARDHDPTLALFSGPDGLDAIRALVRVAARLLRPAGLLCFEHADLQGESAPAVVVGRTGAFSRRTRQPRSDRPAAVRHGRPQRLILWQDGPGERDRSADEPTAVRRSRSEARPNADQRLPALRLHRRDRGPLPEPTDAARKAIEARRMHRAADRHRLRHRRGRVQSRTRCSGCWTPRSAAATCRRRC